MTGRFGALLLGELHHATAAKCVITRIALIMGLLGVIVTLALAGLLT